MSPRLCVAPKEWFSAAELAEMALPGLPSTKQGLLNLAGRDRWAARLAPDGSPLQRKRQGRGGGVEYHFSLLPAPAIAQLMAAQPGAVAQRPDRESLWMRWERLPKTMKDEAGRKLSAIQRVEDLVRAGLPKTRAVEETAARLTLEGEKTSASAIYDWFRRIAGVDAADRVVYLADNYQGRVSTKAIPAEAMDLYKADFLRLSKPTPAACYRRLERIARDHGWALPSAKTVHRRLDAEVPVDVQLFLREGENALAHAFPHMERSRAGIAALQIVNLDGHLWDNRVEWPDGEISRPWSLAVQDIASGRPLAVRFDKSLNRHLVRLALSDLFRDHGLPDVVLMDNGRENASADISGGQPTRWRWKVREEEPAGILKRLGIKAIFAQPYWGQAKPIERMFRDWAGDLAKHPAFEGSYTGPNTTSKPENYGSRAIPIAEFEARVREELVHYNAQRGRAGLHMAGRSFDEVFTALVERRPPRRATAEQLRMCLMASQPVSMDARTGSVRIADHRYWSRELAALKRQRVVVHFDPEDLAKDVHVYTLDGRFLCEAERRAPGSFDNVADGRAHGKLRRDYQRTVKKAAKLQSRLDAADVAARLPVAPVQPAKPGKDEKIVRPAFGAPRTPEQAGGGKTFDELWERGVAALPTRR